MLVRGDGSHEPARNDQAFIQLKGQLDWITVDAAKLWCPHCKGNQGSPGHWRTDVQLNADLKIKLFYISQNHRIIQVERDHCGSPGPTSLLKQGCSKAHGTGLYPDSFRVSPLREIPQSFWAICSSRWSLHSKEVPLHIQVELTVHQFLPVALCHIAWQHQKEPNSIACHPPFRYLYGWWSPSSVISFEAEQTWLFQAVPSKRDTSVP